MRVLYHFILWRIGFEKPETYYTPRECERLEHYARGQRSLAELGCWQGVNTARLRRVMHSEGMLFAIDPYSKGRLGFSAAEIIAKEEVGKIKNGSVRWLKMTDLQAAALLKREGGSFDFIFSDTLNTYEGLRDSWTAWSPLLKPGGVYVIANSHETPEHPIAKAGSVRYTNDVVLRDSRFTHLETIDTFTFMRKLHES